MKRLFCLFPFVLACIAAYAQPVKLAGPDGVVLSGEYLLPPNGNSNAPAMLLLHGCGGLRTKSGGISARPARMASLLQELGYGVLMLDSFTNRGVREICTVPVPQRKIDTALRADDAQFAISWLRARREIDGNRVGVLGWSNGASTVLRLVARSATGVKVAVAFYPSCKRSLDNDQYNPDIPTLVLIGEADDWTSSDDCKKLDDRLAGDTFHVVSYPGVYHDFDAPNSELQVRQDIPDGVKPGAGVTSAPDPRATEDAYRRTFKWLSLWLDPNRNPAIWRDGYQSQAGRKAP
ncbi:Dienelactone hydrolase [Andreprevotia lacus DSM 23236]|uniref:Dienelactone hydrolase n=1 Tax=Andreprevotia lacus DSM 23236 TaxID=1121001 RepID=A0A1W1XEF0_9NEIS|nr:dienelactone hydrolase family protein [Andreprevotia lacus]SMC22222.1 Dienelactone hydrolase [Andreprevotia lacus DSM 23236]